MNPLRNRLPPTKRRERMRADILQTYITQSEHPEVARRLVGLIFRRGICGHCQVVDLNGVHRQTRWIPKRDVGWGNGRVLHLCLEHLWDESRIRAVIEAIGKLAQQEGK